MRALQCLRRHGEKSDETDVEIVCGKNKPSSTCDMYYCCSKSFSTFARFMGLSWVIDYRLGIKLPRLFNAAINVHVCREGAWNRICVCRSCAHRTKKLPVYKKSMVREGRPDICDVGCLLHICSSMGSIVSLLLLIPRSCCQSSLRAVCERIGSAKR